MNHPGPVPMIAARRALIDRRAVAERLVGAEADQHAAILDEVLAAGRAEIARQLAEAPARGKAAAAAMAFLADQLVRLAFDAAASSIDNWADLANSIALAGLGGTGRGEMAPYSDLDLMFIVPEEHKEAARALIEGTLYRLWDLKWTIGHAVRDPAELVALAADDMTIRTAFLEARWIWGSQALFDRTRAHFNRELLTGNGRDFVAAKMAERDERHARLGDSRYVVEPNVKDGKGGLRDLHTLSWISRHLFGISSPAEMADRGLLTPAEAAKFDRAERFFWAVRCHLHFAAGRAEERLGFDFQREIAAAMRYADRPGKSAVERFMHFYFLQAKAVGDLTGQFLGHLDEQLGRKGLRFALPTLRRNPARLHGFRLDRGRLSIPSDDFFAREPVRLLELFAIAARERLEIHPRAMRVAAENAKLVDHIRDDPRANALFLETLTNRDAPDTVLRWMNEAGVFGRFVPDFGRVVAQMQFDMYHHYTVDEHTIRAIGLLASIERGELAKDHPLASALFRQLGSRRTLYLAVLLHDIAKGRGGDHSEIGAEIALELCPRLGLDDAETETVSWLVLNHLLMSRTAMRRDLSDPKTIEDFALAVQSPERLRLLLILTVVDIRAVSPVSWNDWKRQLLKTLYDAAEERIRLGHKQHGRSEQVARRKERLAEQLGWQRPAIKAHARRLSDSYWLAEPEHWQADNALQIAEAEAELGTIEPSVVARDEPDRGATRITIFAPDAPGLFYRICAALAGAGASIIEARIHTTRDGKALDNLLIQDSQKRPYSDSRIRKRIVTAVENALVAEELPKPPPMPPLPRRKATFKVAPSVVIAPGASTRTTVVEVNARDRDGLLARLARVFHQQGLQLHSAHIATYGERAVDTFYLTDAAGKKLGADAIERLHEALLKAAGKASNAK